MSVTAVHKDVFTATTPTTHCAVSPVESSCWGPESEFTADSSPPRRRLLQQKLQLKEAHRHRHVPTLRELLETGAACVEDEDRFREEEEEEEEVSYDDGMLFAGRSSSSSSEDCTAGGSSNGSFGSPPPSVRGQLLETVRRSRTLRRISQPDSPKHDATSVPCMRCGNAVRLQLLPAHLETCHPFGRAGSLNLRVSPDLYVTFVEEGGAAHKAGVRAGDCILRVEGPLGEFPVATKEDLVRAAGPRGGVFEGSEVVLVVLRGREVVARWRGERQDQAERRRRISSAGFEKQEGEATMRCHVVVAPATLASRETQRKKLENLRRGVFPDLNLALVETFLSDPTSCRSIVRRIFDGVDTRGTGYLTEKAMRRVHVLLAAQAGLPPPAEGQVATAFASADVGQSGQLSCDEFFAQIRSLLLDVLWGEGGRVACPSCGLRVREACFERHTTLCAGGAFPMGVLPVTLTPSGPLKVHSAAPVSGIPKAAVLEKVNGRAVGSRIGVARAVAPAAGVFPGCRVVVEYDGGKKHVVELRGLSEAGEIHVMAEVEAAVSRSYPDADLNSFSAMLCDFEAAKSVVRQAFIDCDSEGNGFLTLPELTDAFEVICTNSGVHPPSAATVRGFFKEVGGDHCRSGRVPYEEFLPVVRRYYVSLVDPALWTRFNLTSDPDMLE